jgi:hypothetical protein
VAHPTCRSALLALFALLSSGCAALVPETCEQFEERRKQTNYATEYAFEGTNVSSNSRALAKNELAAAPLYQMKLDTDNTRPCSHVKIRKEIALIRRDNTDLIFEETREFFTENGTRIAQKKEVLTGQLNKSGHYSAVVPLPIPRNAPPGKYRLTSTLMLRTRNDPKPKMLARTTASFQVTAAKNK